MQFLHSVIGEENECTGQNSWVGPARPPKTKTVDILGAQIRAIKRSTASAIDTSINQRAGRSQNETLGTGHWARDRVQVQVLLICKEGREQGEREREREREQSQSSRQLGA